ncbi:hypothetical protein RJT34_13101 [Clitoria ternatea]|uniref:Uncharacterized protein n=1 Tax=Clitoria ternatea TaxID=43366 RepID=A0AAN9JNB7_CLITE
MKPWIRYPPRNERETQDDEVEASKLQKLSLVVVFAHSADAPSSSDWMQRSGKFKPVIKKEMVELEAEEVDLLYDVQHWETLSYSKKHFITHVLAFFVNSDGIVFGEFGCKARAFYGFQIAMENIHSSIAF